MTAEIDYFRSSIEYEYRLHDERLEALIKKANTTVHKLIEENSSLYLLMSQLGDEIDEHEQASLSAVSRLEQLSDKESITLFRLRIKAATMTEEALWRGLIVAGPDNPEAKSMRLTLQMHLYGHYTDKLDLLYGDNARPFIAHHDAGVLQEITILSLLSKDPDPASAVFVSDFGMDRAKVDMIKYYFGETKPHQIWLQSKTSLHFTTETDADALINIITAYDTGNIDDSGELPIYTWDTAKALHQDLFGKNMDQVSVDANAKILKKPLNQNPIRYINNLGSRVGS